MSKYLERQFGVAPSKANLLIGRALSLLPSTAISFRLHHGSDGGRGHDVQRVHRATLSFELRENVEVLHRIADDRPGPVTDVPHLLPSRPLGRHRNPLSS